MWLSNFPSYFPTEIIRRARLAEAEFEIKGMPSPISLFRSLSSPSQMILMKKGDESTVIKEKNTSTCDMNLLFDENAMTERLVSLLAKRLLSAVIVLFAVDDDDSRVIPHSQ